AGKVKQLITGSTGLDDAEWGVTLFARDTFQIKKIVYEMRFDPVSAEYADFGEFFVGIQLPLDELFRRLQLYLVRVLIIDRSNDYEQDSKGWVTERSIVHAWKACVPQGTRGSNPLPSVSSFILLPLVLAIVIADQRRSRLLIVCKSWRNFTMCARGTTPR